MRLDRGQIEVVDEKVAEVLRLKTPAERIKIGFDMWVSARNMLTAHLNVLTLTGKPRKYTEK